jgi:integrase
MKKARLRPRTARSYRSSLDLVLIPRFGRWKLGAIDADAIAKLTRDLEREGLHAIDPERRARPLTRSSIDNHLKPLCGALGHAVRRGKIASNPFDVLTSDDRAAKGEPETPYEWCDGDFDALLAASSALAAKKESRYDYTPLLRLTARLGLRLGEVTGLQWWDFDKDAGYLTVSRQWTRDDGYAPPKTKAGTRRIPLPADLRDELIALRLHSRYSQDEHPIFASREGGPLQHRNVARRGFERSRDEAKLPKRLTFHDLRHAAASRMIAAGLSPVVVAELLGHGDATVTLSVYAHLWDRQRTDEAVRAALA